MGCTGKDQVRKVRLILNGCLGDWELFLGSRLGGGSICGDVGRKDVSVRLFQSRFQMISYVRTSLWYKLEYNENVLSSFHVCLGAMTMSNNEGLTFGFPRWTDECWVDGMGREESNTWDSGWKQQFGVEDRQNCSCVCRDDVFWGEDWFEWRWDVRFHKPRDLRWINNDRKRDRDTVRLGEWRVWNEFVVPDGGDQGDDAFSWHVLLFYRGW